MSLQHFQHILLMPGVLALSGIVLFCVWLHSAQILSVLTNPFTLQQKCMLYNNEFAVGKVHAITSIPALASSVATDSKFNSFYSKMLKNNMPKTQCGSHPTHVS